MQINGIGFQKITVCKHFPRECVCGRGLDHMRAHVVLHIEQNSFVLVLLKFDFQLLMFIENHAVVYDWNQLIHFRCNIVIVPFLDRNKGDIFNNAWKSHIPIVILEKSKMLYSINANDHTVPNINWPSRASSLIHEWVHIKPDLAEHNDYESGGQIWKSGLDKVFVCTFSCPRTTMLVMILGLWVVNYPLL